MSYDDNERYGEPQPLVELMTQIGDYVTRNGYDEAEVAQVAGEIRQDIADRDGNNAWWDQVEAQQQKQDDYWYGPPTHAGEGTRNNSGDAAATPDPWAPGGVYANAVERGRLEDEANWDRQQQLWEAQDPHFSGSTPWTTEDLLDERRIGYPCPFALEHTHEDGDGA